MKRTKQHPFLASLLKPFSIYRFAFCCIATIATACFLTPILIPHSAQNLLVGPQQPSLSHWFGTDLLGRDFLLRILYGGRTSLTVSLCSTGISLMIGTLYGTLSGLSKPLGDKLLMRLLDILYPLPFPLIVVLLASWNNSPITLIFALGCVKWLIIARIVRSQTLSIKSKTFIESARCYGQSFFGTIRKHILPNLLTTLTAYTTLMIPSMILDEAFISFLGLGIRPPQTSWGFLILDGAKNGERYPWLLLLPCAIFAITVLSFHFLGERLNRVRP